MNVRSIINSLVLTVVLPFFAWVALSVIQTDKAVASLSVRQIEDDRVNNIVYNLSLAIPQIGTSLGNIDETLKEHTQKIDEIAKGQRDTRARLYCYGAHPLVDGGEYEKLRDKRDECIDELISD